MREHQLRALHGHRTRRVASGKASVLIPNLLKRQFTVTQRNKAWMTDITYTRTWQGWLYLPVLMDLFSRKIVGWATAPTIHREIVLNAMLRAVRKRRPRGTLNRQLAEADIRDYIDTVYNPLRRHSHLEGVSPDQFEAAHRGLRRGVQ
jgi:transposase InsO family protein